jgi:predicted NBD/HSP70 family sugar kinase
MIGDEIYAIGIDVGGTKIAGGIVALTSGLS